MAELSEPAAAAERGSCCSPEAPSACCEPFEKAGCRSGVTDASRGCPTGQSAEATEIRETVREKYAAAARAAAEQQTASSCCGPISLTAGDEHRMFGAALYEEAETAGSAASAVASSLGCGVPTAVADLHAGETVLDLGSGAGADVLISARRVGPTGRVIGLDMTEEMLQLARRNAAEAGLGNVEFVKGYIEDIPLADGSVDVVVSNCVLNLSADKPRVLREAARVLRPGGRFAISDVIASPDMDDVTRADMAQWTGCIAGALTEVEFRDGLAAAGFTEVEIRPTHQVHEFARAAIIRARKLAPSTSSHTTNPELSSTMPSLHPTRTPVETAATAGHRVELFEPAMCCESGVCGPSVDQTLIDLREDLRWAQSAGATVSRHNLSSDPDAFVANPKVTGLMTALGERALPALLVDGEIAVHGRYPDREELAGFLAAGAEAVKSPAGDASGCGCGEKGCC